MNFPQETISKNLSVLLLSFSKLVKIFFSLEERNIHGLIWCDKWVYLAVYFFPRPNTKTLSISKKKIFKFNSSSIAILTVCIF